MALRNLCLVFGPTIVRKAISEENNTLVADMNHTYTVVEFLLKKVQEEREREYKQMEVVRCVKGGVRERMLIARLLISKVHHCCFFFA